MLPLLQETAHRPWPLPTGPWIMHQQWNDLLFAHWRVPVDELRKLVPACLELDLFADEAWVGVVPFWMSGVRFRRLPPIPGTSTFPELNVRTYVRDRKQGLPGVYFFSLDAASLLAVCGARLSFHLPYYWSRMSVRRNAGSHIEYENHRRHDSRGAELKATYHPVGEEFIPQAGTLAHFLSERYCLYTTTRRGEPLRCNIHHPPWQLRTAEAKFHLNSMAAAAGINLPLEDPLLHYAAPQNVLVWGLEPA